MDLRYIVTTNCNANCFFCLNEYMGPTKSKYFMSTPQDYYNLSKVAVELEAEGCTITGGEPTLRKDLEQIINEIKKTGLNITVVSNGYRLIDYMHVWKNIDKLHVSFHTFNEKEWEKITKVKEGLYIVKKNLIAIRKAYPDLIIRLNVVATEENSTPQSIVKYLEFAQQIKANISVFQNGYLRLLKEVEKSNFCEKIVDFWDLDTMGGEIIENTERTRTYRFGDVKVHLTYLSSEMHNGRTIWVTPMNEGFSDIRKRSPLVNFNLSLQKKDFSKIKLSLLSLLQEARLIKEAEQKGMQPNELAEYNNIITERIKNLDISMNKYFFVKKF